jgi:hypothetical protein
MVALVSVLIKGVLMFRLPWRSKIQPGFRVTRVNVIESDEGFSVELLPPGGLTCPDLKYTQGDKTLIMHTELCGISPYFLVIFPDSIKNWNSPYNEELIDESTRKLIIENVRRAFAAKGQKIAVHGIDD